MLDFTIEEMIYLNASTNNGLEKDRKEVIRNLKLTYATINDSEKDDVRELIHTVERLNDKEYKKLISRIPFDTGVPDDVLHEEIIDTYEED